MNKNSKNAPKKTSPTYQMAIGLFPNRAIPDKRKKNAKHKVNTRDMY